MKEEPKNQESERWREYHRESCSLNAEISVGENMGGEKVRQKMLARLECNCGLDSFISSLLSQAVKEAYKRGAEDAMNSTAPKDPKLREIWSRLWKGQQFTPPTPSTPQTKRKKRERYGYIKGTADEMFDLVCFANWLAGNTNQNIPVDESREVWERIKKKLATPP